MDIQTEKDRHKGALFPRVHVSETRIPGPRAPPRNKMALFEQLTIPPHRFVPPLVQKNSHKVDSQSGGQDTNSGFVKPNQVKLRQLSSNESDVSRGKEKCEALRCSVAERCFYSETSKSSAACDSGDKDCTSLLSRHASELPPDSHMQKLWNCSTAESDIVYYAKRGHSSTDMRTQHSSTDSRHISLSTERMARQPCRCTGIKACDTYKLHAFVGAIAENQSAEVSHCNENANTESSGRSAGISLTNKAHIAKAFLQVEKAADECIHECNGANDTDSLVQQMVCSDRSSEVAGDIGQQKHLKSLRKCDVDRCNFLPSIIPKHVIGAIGQREFWEARKTMLQQQKTLSMQVFELHRLIEVQRLIAAMPGLLLEGRGKCFVVKGSTQPEIAKVSNKLVTKESLNKEAKHCAKQKQAVVKVPKKLMKLSCDVGNTTVNNKCQNPSLRVLPLKPIHVSLDHRRVSTWGFIPTPFVKSQWLKEGSQNYGLCRGPMAFEPPTLGHWYNGQQVLQNGSCVFTNWSRPCNFLPRDIPSPHLASQKLVNGHLIRQLDCAPGAQTSESLPTPNKATSVLRKSSKSTLNPSLCAQHNKPIINSQQEACTTERQRSSDCAYQSIKFTGDLYVPDKAKSVSLAGSHEFRSGLGFQTFRKMVSNDSDSIAQPVKVKDMISVTESYVAHKNDTLFSVPLQIVSSVQKGEKNGVAASKVIRAVPRPASEVVQAAAKILKFIQQNESSQGD